MLYLASPVVPQKIEAQAVPFRVHLVQELRTQDLPLGIIEQASKTENWTRCPQLVQSLAMRRSLRLPAASCVFTS